MIVNDNFVTVKETDGNFELSWSENSTFITEDAMKEVVSDYEYYVKHAPTTDEKARFMKDFYNNAARVGFTEGYSYCMRKFKEQSAEQTQGKSINFIAIQVLDSTNIFDVRDKLCEEYLTLECCIVNIDRQEIQLRIEDEEDMPCAYEIKEYLDTEGIKNRVYNFFVKVDSIKNKTEVIFTIDGLPVRIWDI